MFISMQGLKYKHSIQSWEWNFMGYILHSIKFTVWTAFYCVKVTVQIAILLRQIYGMNCILLLQSYVTNCILLRQSNGMILLRQIYGMNCIYVSFQDIIQPSSVNKSGKVRFLYKLKWHRDQRDHMASFSKTFGFEGTIKKKIPMSVATLSR